MAAPLVSSLAQAESRRLRVLVVGPSHYFYSGVSNYTVSLGNTLAEEHDASVVFLRKLVPRSLYPLRKFVNGDIGFLKLQEGIPRYDGMDYNSPATWRAARRFMLAQKPDVVVVQWWTGAVAHMVRPLVRAAKATGARVVIEMHEVIDPTEASFSALRVYSKVAFRPIARAADAFITHSDRDADLVCQSYGLDKGKVRVIPHGLYDYFGDVDAAAARKTWRTEGQFGILQFGSVRRYKGTLMLLDAFESLPDEVAATSRLVIAGGLWDDGPEIEARVAGSKRKDRILLTGGMVPDKDVGALFEAADLVTLPYLRASQSGVAAIAMARGKPIVATRVGGLEEGLRDYEGTRFIDVDAAALRDAIVASHGAWRRGEARRHPAPPRGFSDTSRSYKDLFQSLLASGRSG